MENINSTTELKNAIVLLEAEQAYKGRQLKEEFNHAVKSVLIDKALSSHLIENILGVSIGIATGYLSKKLVVGASVNIFRKVIGNILQLGVTTVASTHLDTIRSYGQTIIKYFFRKK